MIATLVVYEIEPLHLMDDMFSNDEASKREIIEIGLFDNEVPAAAKAWLQRLVK